MKGKNVAEITALIKEVLGQEEACRGDRSKKITYRSRRTNE